LQKYLEKLFYYCKNNWQNFSIIANNWQNFSIIANNWQNFSVIAKIIEKTFLLLQIIGKTLLQKYLKTYIVRRRIGGKFIFKNKCF
jgi:hypothetical protein